MSSKIHLNRYQRLFHGNKEWEIDEKGDIQTHLTKPKAQLMKNVLVAIIGISEYDAWNFFSKGNTNLPAVDEGVYKNVELWKGHFGYDVKVLSSVGENRQICRNKIFADDITNFLEGPVVETMVNSQKTDQQYDGLILVLSGHGKSKGVITSDNKLYPTDYIRRYFSKDRQLLNIPKLLLINACRGSKFSQIVKVPENLRTKWRGYGPEYIHPDSDINTFYSTTDGHPVPDNTKFIEAVSEVFTQTDCTKYHLSEVTTMITEEIGNSALFDYFCPEYIQRSKYVIFMQRKNNGKVEWIPVGRKDFVYRFEKWWKENKNKTGSTIIILFALYLFGYIAYAVKAKMNERKTPNIGKYNEAVQRLLKEIIRFSLELIKVNM